MLYRVEEARFSFVPAGNPSVLVLKDLEDLGKWLRAPLPPDLICFECHALPENCEALPDPVLVDGAPTPGIDYVIANPEHDFGTMYQLAQLAPRFPVRARLALRPGVEKALRLAAALKIGVLLMPEQPDADEIHRLAAALNAYLHDHVVEAPVEPFHSWLAALVRDEPVDLWQISENNPATVVDLVSNTDGLPARVADRAGLDVEAFRQSFWDIAAAHPECQECRHREICHGYFKWPDPSYDCTRLRGEALDILCDAADALKKLFPNQSEPTRA